MTLQTSKGSAVKQILSKRGDWYRLCLIRLWWEFKKLLLKKLLVQCLLNSTYSINVSSYYNAFAFKCMPSIFFTEFLFPPGFSKIPSSAICASLSYLPQQLRLLWMKAHFQQLHLLTWWLSLGFPSDPWHSTYLTTKIISLPKPALFYLTSLCQPTVSLSLTTMTKHWILHQIFLLNQFFTFASDLSFPFSTTH